MSEQITHDFEDGAGPVPAHQHVNGGGWVADTAHVDDTAYVGPDACVSGTARVYGNDRTCKNHAADDDAIKYGPGHPRLGSPGTIEELFTETDWGLFHQQKRSLWTVLGLSPHSLGHDFDIPENEAAMLLEHLSGIMNLMEAFQDTAADILGIEAANSNSHDDDDTEGEE
jgi:hypothetical protein